MHEKGDMLGRKPEDGALIMRIAEKYRGLPKELLLEKARELGMSFERYCSSCSQCTAAALREILGFEDVVVRVATSSCGGQAGFSAGACGGVIGGTIVLDYYLGRPAGMLSAAEEIPEGMAELARAMQWAKSLGDKFIGHYGSILCPQIQQKLFGRSFNFHDSDDWNAFAAAGARTDPTKCMAVVGNAVQWTLETLVEAGVVVLGPAPGNPASP